jgi:hypothetical protein
MMQRKATDLSSIDAAFVEELSRENLGVGTRLNGNHKGDDFMNERSRLHVTRRKICHLAKIRPSTAADQVRVLDIWRGQWMRLTIS